MVLRFSIFGNPYHFTFQFFGLLLFFVLLFSSLGVWQIHRAQEKRHLIHAYAERQTQQLIGYNIIFDKTRDSRFYSVSLQGRFDNQHQLLLDNKTLDGQLGYEVYTPFLLENATQAILVDRGWVPAHPDRRILPAIEPVQGRISIQGVLNAPPSYFSLGAMTEAANSSFPLRVQYINIQELAPLLGLSLAPYIVWLDPAAAHGFKRHWKVTLMGPEKHVMYAVQWFAFALSLLVIFGVLNLRRVEK